MAFQIPHLRQNDVSKQLIVKDKPMLLLAGELQNSSMTSAAYMREQWQNLADMHINAILGSVSWEMIEPKEDAFDFTELDQVILDARSYDIHLVLLWFGSFKNGMSTYAPSWVKRDHKRFPRARMQNEDGSLGTGDVLSIFHTEAQKSDAKAFGMLLRHIKEIDEEHSTVVMVQVENESGLLGDSRDRSPAANKRFAEDVPEELMSYLSNDFETLHPTLQANLGHFLVYKKGTEKSAEKKSRSWESVFGGNKQADEIFMAYHYSLYLSQVAAAGKAEYPIPLYTNVWQKYGSDDGESDKLPVIVSGGGDPGSYPSGGGVVNVLDIWQKFATNLDMICPDIYLNNYAESCVKYRHRNQPLFIPEQRRDDYGARRIWLAYGSHQCLGTAPFGIDTLEAAECPFTTHYGLLSSVSDIVLEAQRVAKKSFGFYFDEPPEAGHSDPTPAVFTKFGGFEVKIERCFVFGNPSSGAGMVIHTNADAQGEAPRLLLIGYGFQAVFQSLNPKSTFTGILSMVELEAVRDAEGAPTKLKPLRRLNGDETRSGNFAMMPCDDPDYGGFPICVTIPARTMLAEVTPYSLEEED